MPAFSLIFNKLQVQIPARELLLSVDSSASLQFPNENAQPIKTRDLLGLFSSGKVWVTHGNGCRIHFTILLDGQQCKNSDAERLIEDLAAYIVDVPLWPQVSLNAELELPERGTSGGLQSDFSILLRQVPVGATFASSNIPQTSTLPDVQVPAGIRCFQLRKVKVIMNFSSGRYSLNPRPLLPSPDSSAQPPSVLHFDPLSCQDHEMLDNDASSYKIEIAIPLLKSHKLTKNELVLPSPPNSQEEESESIPVDHGRTSYIPDLDCAREMVYVALNKLIGSRQNKNQLGVRVVFCRPTLNLSKLAPALFSPGFAEAMTQRSQFIPTISHALSVSLLRNVQAPGLRRKLLSLVTNPTRPPDGSGSVEPVSCVDHQSDHAALSVSRKLGMAVDERLWAMMHTSLNLPLSARHAAPPKAVDTSTDGASAMCRAEVSTAEPANVQSVRGAPISSIDHAPRFPTDEFEDLFGEVPDDGASEGFEALFSEDTNDSSVEEDFEDLFEDENPTELDEIDHARSSGPDLDSDIMSDHCIRYWEDSRDRSISTGDPLSGYFTGNHDVSDIENEDMLI